MANDKPRPTATQQTTQADPAQTQVVFSGNIAADDLTWAVRLSVDEFQRALQAPSAWVGSLAALPGWKAPAPALSPEFYVAVERTGFVDPKGWITLQGISDTNALTIIVPATSGAGAEATETVQAGDPYGEFWTKVASDPNNPPTLKKELPVIVLTDVARWSAHFEILDPVDAAIDRAARIGTFLLATAQDPSGYAAMLNGLPQTTTYVANGVETSGPAIRFSAATAPATTSPTGVGYAADADADPDGSETTVCNMVTGSYDGSGGGAITGSLVKYYGGGESPQEPTDPGTN